MARKSTHAAATLTVTHQETLTINSRDYGGYTTHTFASIANVDKRVETITTSESTIATFSTVVSAGQWIPAKVKYMRFTNLDDTNHITLTFANENDDEMAVKLDAGQSFVMNGDNSGGMVDVLDAIDGTGLTYALGDMKSITADADTASCDLEIYVASVA
jgi:hypothetical protein